MKLACALIVLFSMQVKAAAPSCPSLFSPVAGVSVSSASLRAQSRENYDSPNIEAYNVLRSVIAKHPGLRTSLLKPLVAVLRDEQLSTYHVRAKLVLEALNEAPAGTAIDQLLTLAQEKLQADLLKRMPLVMATERSELLREKTLTKEMMMRALGGMSAEESLHALIGANGPHNIDPDSLVGRYLARAGKPVGTLVDSFRMGPGYKGRGGEKLYVAVDESTAELANEIFSTNPQLLIQDHETNQGTLTMIHDSKSITYSQYDNENQIAHETGKMAPLMVLSSLEASNTKNYFDLGTVDQKFAKLPWGLRNSKRPNETSYCRVGGYGSCTHWIGEMAIGEKSVKRYKVPRFIGDDPYGQRPPGMKDGDIQVRNVGTYDSFVVPDNEPEKIGSTERRDRLTRMVWTQKLGREQLWSVVGDKKAFGLNEGEWANPGWVLYSFLTRTTFERVPVVLVYVDNASLKLNRRKIDKLREHMNLH